MRDHRNYVNSLSSCENKAPPKKLNGTRALDLCDTGEVFYQMSYQGK